ncbi:hypothetical protein LJB91_01150 [Bacteroidales bacterium OttesenSCG-928-L03]|nr:hypothetical protein [Bacteroidales bacterium OttesenSCG-928-L03]
MKRRIEYYEVQRLKSWWFWAFMGIALLPVSMMFYQQIIIGQTFGDTPTPDIALIIALVILLLVAASLLFSKLTTFINEEGIYYRYFPFHFRDKFIPWDEIEEMQIREFSPIWEFGGYGIRKQVGTRFTKKKTGYIVSGKYGFELRLKNGEYILIGTRRPDEIAEIINSIGK